MALPAPLPARLPAPQAHPSQTRPPQARAGFVLYVAAPPDASPADLADVAESLHELAVDALPGAETVVALSLVPGGSDEVRRVGERLTDLRLVAASPTTSTADSTADINAAGATPDGTRG
ncbi:hypothetical protein [Cellulomonas sp. HZM]|uniref:hypothetical protein n=1 Tax=Cellulomonas sp. HZM TaxID=1454010 RepID=UPI0004937333|nr:hypothetical protein [Cellulomonas sp. HZM]